MLLTFSSVFREWGLGWGLSLSNNVIKHTYRKPLSILFPPRIHFLLLVIIGNELTPLPFHPDRVILSFFCTGRSGTPGGASPGGAACAVSFISKYMLKLAYIHLNSHMSKCWAYKENSYNFQSRVWPLQMMEEKRETLGNKWEEREN